MLRITRSDTAKGIRKDPQFVISFNTLLWIHHVRISREVFSLNGRLRSSHAWYRSRPRWLYITVSENPWHRQTDRRKDIERGDNKDRQDGDERDESEDFHFTFSPHGTWWNHLREPFANVSKPVTNLFLSGHGAFINTPQKSASRSLIIREVRFSYLPERFYH